MNRWLAVLLILVAMNIMGCSNGELAGEKPPKAFIKIGDQTYETKLGTYCWKTSCVDTVGPTDLLKEKKAIKVKPGENVTFAMDYEPKPNEFHVVQMNKGNQAEIEVKNHQFRVPSQIGIYYYSYDVWWTDEMHGDASYVFALKVN
ncbi:hypothetical protein [Fictibacillus gelatini]|uniref:hypothetical protein n=1 Tax=Fictibacillus gelatini TaxID=225985 RepID=UPI00040F591F|nr:hypothetical protein [Fictibacillus gelatini]